MLASMRRFNPFDFKGIKPEEAMRRASTLSVATAIVLIVIKSLALWQTGSVSVLAALTDSGLDLVASLVTFYAVRFAKMPPDADHPFGHGKAEAFSALFQAALVFASAALVGRDCFMRFLQPMPVENGLYAIIVLAVSVMLTFLLVMVQTKALQAGSSVAIKADRAHYAMDMASNGLALVGVALGTLGFAMFDAFAGFGVVGLLVWSAIGVLKDAAAHLMDNALGEGDIAAISALVLKDERVLGAHQIRTRISGPYVHIQMHIELEPYQSLEQAHKIVVEVEKRVFAAYPNADIIIHADPKGMAESHGGVFHIK